MNGTVMIKGNKSGIILVLDKDLQFDTLKKDIADKFKETSKFLGKTTMAISFEGRELSVEEQKEVISIIEENSELKIGYVVTKENEQQKLVHKSIESRVSEINSNTGQFYKGNLRSGQVLEVETSVVVIGDVNAGAKVISKGS